MEPIIDQLSAQVGRALVDAVRNTMPGASFDEYFFDNTKAPSDASVQIGN